MGGEGGLCSDSGENDIASSRSSDTSRRPLPARNLHPESSPSNGSAHTPSMIESTPGPSDTETVRNAMELIS